MKQYFSWILTVLFFIVLSCSPTIIFAQPIDPGCEPCQYPAGCLPDGTPCPIDSYLYILLAIGVGYGIKKTRNLENKSNSTFTDSD
jgi:hypothetical protein